MVLCEINHAVPAYVFTHRGLHIEGDLQTMLFEIETLA